MNEAVAAAVGGAGVVVGAGDCDGDDGRDVDGDGAGSTGTVTNERRAVDAGASTAAGTFGTCFPTQHNRPTETV
jgi:hypothetical protein